MNKYKKLAIAAVSMVMAGTMAVSLAACGGNGGGGSGTGTGGGIQSGENTGATVDSAKITALLGHLTENNSQVRENAFNTQGWKTVKDYWAYLKGANTGALKDEYHVLKDDGTLDYTAYTRSTPVTLNIAIGHNSAATSTHFASNLGKTLTLPDGNQYSNGDAKPAWAQMGKDLNITWNDVFKGWSSNSNLNKIVAGDDGASYATTDMYTTDLSVAVSQAAAGISILNLADYLDYMPNFAKFLNENPIVYLSLLQSGMSTTDGSGKTLYVAPYFDGYDDIERYCLMRQDMVEKLLNGDTASTSTATFKDVCGETPSVSAYMGATGKLAIDSLNATGTAVTKIVKNYDAVVTAAKDENTALGAAYKAIAGEAYAEESGNIVDLMNYAVKKNNEATGAQLLTLFRAYIDVCYQKEDGSAYYTSTTRANLFNGYDACWDADDLAALLRCAMTNSGMLVGEGKELGGIAPRSGQNDRTPDMVSLAGQLFGARGATSRFEQTYIDNSGNLQDARNDAHYWEAMALFHNFRAEGLIADYTGYGDFKGAQGLQAEKEYLMLYDYSQTQTSSAIALDAGIEMDLPEGYHFGPVMTPVAKWDVNGNGTYGEEGEIIRFTESWRSTKTGGLALNGALKEDANKLKAALQFVDYLYSEDGQIVSTYGPMATNAQGTGGFWYNEAGTKGAADSFQYKGNYYKGTMYKGKATPTVTTTLYDAFAGKEGVTGGGAANLEGTQRSFTDYARKLIGSTLPVGVKDQSFENQLTASMGREGANKVGQGLALGTVKGMSLAIDENNYWFTCVPSGLPIASNIQADILDNTNMQHLKYITGTAKKSGDKNFLSIMNYVILNGLTGTYNQQDEQYTF